MWHKGLFTIELNGNFGNIVRIDNEGQWKGYISKLKRDLENLIHEAEELEGQITDDLKVIQKIKELEKPEAETGEKLLQLEDMLRLKREKLRTAKNILKDWNSYNVYRLTHDKRERIKEIFVGKLEELLNDNKYQ